jgi:pimeloyl-ACP methyl ester carboxylesterase
VRNRRSVVLASLRCHLGRRGDDLAVTNDEFWVETGSQLLIELEVACLATFVLIHGAGDSAWYWHLLEPELRDRGHEVVAMDLPCEDDSAGLIEYADTVIGAIGDRTDLVLVAQSFGGFTAPLVCERVPVDLMVLVAAMIPAPGKAPDDYWANTQYAAAASEAAEGREETDDQQAATIATFYHDVPAELAAEAMRRGRRQSEARMKEPSPLKAWPDVPTRVLLCRDDRLFPVKWLRRVVKERLGITHDEIDSGHCVALSRPQELADRLHGYLS